MQTKLGDPPIFTPEELETISRRRAEARARAKRQLTKDDQTFELAGPDDAGGAPIDPDNPPLTDTELRRFRPAHEIRPDLVKRYLQKGTPTSTTASAPLHYRNRVTWDADGNTTMDVGTVNKVTLDNITDVHSHVIMREGVTYVHVIEFRGEGSVKLVYTSEGKLKEFVCKQIDIEITGDDDVVLKRRLKA